MKQIMQRLGFAALLLGLAALLLAVMFWALSIGSVHLSWGQVYEVLAAQWSSPVPIETAGQGPVHDIVWLLRFPRLVLAAIVGCGLAVSGVIMQAIVKNPLADPYILGISSGASRCDGRHFARYRRGVRRKFRRHFRIFRCVRHFACGAFYFKFRRAGQFDQAFACRYGVERGMQFVFFVYRVFCE